MLKVNYLFGCPNCNGSISVDRLHAGIPCETCLPGTVEKLDIRTIYDLLVKYSTLKGYSELYMDLEMYDDILRLFKKIVGGEPWSLQRYWLNKLIRGESFSLSAPTGVGKTTTLIVYSVYSHTTSLFVVPTKSLRDQICEKLKKISHLVSCNKPEEDKVNVVTFHSINKNIDEFVGIKPKLLMVDDADMILKSGKTTERIAKVLQIPQEVFDDTIKMLRLKRMLRFKEDEDLINQVKELESKILGYKSSVQFIVSSATLKPKGYKQMALRFLVGFEPSTIQIYNRNVIDSFTYSKNVNELVREIGDVGGLILVSKDYGKKYVEQITDNLNAEGYRAMKAISGRKFLEKFSNGDVDFLVGSASYYGVAVRGIDEPKRLKYVIFYGVPKTKLPLEDSLNNPLTALKIGELLKLDVTEYRKRLIYLSPAELQAVKIALRNKVSLNGKLGELVEDLAKLKDIILDTIKANKIDKLVSDSFVIKKDTNKHYIFFPDIITYIQGSGRSSRIMNGGLTLGLSVVLVDDLELFDILNKKLRRIAEIAFMNFNELKLDEVREKLNKSRSNGSECRSMNFKTALLVVESPTKARTISKIFGRGVRREIYGIPVYETIIIDDHSNTIIYTNIIASKGHLTDLTTEELGYYGVEINDKDIVVNYSPLYRCMSCGKTITKKVSTCPYCGSSMINSSEKIVNAIRLISTEVDEVYIATDPDQEGEKIAYDIYSLISPYNQNIFRISYNEITKTAVLNAIKSKAKINESLVKAQIARRIEDRWIGFELSSILRSALNDNNNGTGRVQGPVLKWVVGKTSEYKANIGYVVDINIGDYVIRKFFKTKKDAETFISQLNVKIAKLAERTSTIDPLPPFTTDSLLIDAYSKFRINSSLAMKVAQELFEAGLITYHRTDSIHISPYGISIAREYLEKIGSNDFVGRSWGNEGAHEAIRPTRSMDVEELRKEIEENPFQFGIKFTWAHYRLYDLIFRRFIGSQMSSATAIYTTYEININGELYTVELPTKVHGGFSSVYGIRVYNLDENRLTTRIRKGSLVSLLTYADVIRLMKDTNIGRPSTYVRTVQSLIRHGYVVESKKRSFLIATNKGQRVYEILNKYFSDMVSENRTSHLITKIDKINRNELNAEDVIMDLLNEIKNIKLVNPLQSEQYI
ncbi:topoisomerase [Sulfolobus acidocaldarius SUSAZ]|nr:topoisomerase [Sulfolobus acidocaldarius SUSAZ]